MPFVLFHHAGIADVFLQAFMQEDAGEYGLGWVTSDVRTRSVTHHDRDRAGFARAGCRSRNKMEIIMVPLGNPMSTFNYDIIAELFPTWNDVALFPAKARRVRRQPIGYGRFVRAAYAIRFAIEELPTELLPATCLKVDEQLFDGDGIRRLYDSEDYPLVRRASSLISTNVKHLSHQ